MMKRFGKKTKLGNRLTMRTRLANLRNANMNWESVFLKNQICTNCKVMDISKIANIFSVFICTSYMESKTPVETPAVVSADEGISNR
jgi:hypothetical protein